MRTRSLSAGVAALFLAATLVFFFLDELKVETTDPSIQVLNGKTYYKKKLFTGVLIERNLRHDFLSKSHYQNGEKEGISYSFHHDGTIVGKSLFHQGKKHGQQDTWYVDGKHRSTSYFKDGVADGTYTEWHPNGKIYRFQRIQNGVEIENKMFYETGVIYSNYVVRDQRVYGIQGEPLCNTVKQEGFK